MFAARFVLARCAARVQLPWRVSDEVQLALRCVLLRCWLYWHVLRTPVVRVLFQGACGSIVHEAYSDAFFGCATGPRVPLAVPTRARVLRQGKPIGALFLSQSLTPPQYGDQHPLFNVSTVATIHIAIDPFDYEYARARARVCVCVYLHQSPRHLTHSAATGTLSRRPITAMRVRCRPT